MRQHAKLGYTHELRIQGDEPGGEVGELLAVEGFTLARVCKVVKTKARCDGWEKIEAAGREQISTIP
jgi:hypothetical protein